MRFAPLLLVITACSDGVTITRLPGSPSVTRALTFGEGGRPIAIGGESEFGLAYLTTPGDDGDAWIRADGVPAFDANAKLLRGPSDILAISEMQVHRWKRANDAGSFAWTTIAIPVGTTPGTEFAIDDLGHLFALDLQPDGAGAVWTWRTDTTRWHEIPMTRPIGVGATHFAIADSGNSVAWWVPGVGITWVDRIADTRTDISCEAPELGACAANVRGLAFRGNAVLSALVCDGEPNGLRSVVTLTTQSFGPVSEFRDESCRAMASISYGTKLIVADSLYVLSSSGDGLVPIAEAEPALTYTLLDPSTAFGFGDGIYRIDL
ncbi:MAG: hypothetical protein ACKV2T_16660 [Kofleriaceae bacterium]